MKQKASSDSQTYAQDGRDPRPRGGSRRLEQASMHVMDVDTLISLMGPLITSCRLCGIIHMRPHGSCLLRDRNGASRMLERLYSIVLMTVLWLDFVRSLSCFRKDNDIGEQLFLKILFCVWKFVVCCNFTGCFWACLRRRGFFELLDAWTKEVDGTYQNKSCCRYLGRKQIMYTSICWVFVILNVACVAFGYHYTTVFDIDYQPFESDYEYIYVVKGICTAIHLLRSCAWFLPVALFYSTSSLLGFHLLALSEEFVRIKDSKTALEQLDKFRQKHQRLCKLVEQADALISPILAVHFVSSVAILCITFYIIVFPDDGHDANDALLLSVTKIFWFVVSGITLTIFCMGAASVNCKAHGLLRHLYDIDLAQVTIHQNSQLMLLHGRLAGGAIGLTVWGLFVVDKTIILTLVGLLITYFILMLDFTTANADSSSATCVYNFTDFPNGMNSSST